MRSARTITEGDYEIVRADGMKRVVAMSASPLYGDFDVLAGGVTVLTDVTYLRTLEMTMREQRNELMRHAVRDQPSIETLPGVTLPHKRPIGGGFAARAQYLAAHAPGRLGRN